MRLIDLFIDEFPFTGMSTTGNFLPRTHRQADYFYEGNLLTLEINLAGAKKSDIQVTIDENSMMEVFVEEDRKNFCRIPNGYKQKHASYDNGMLTVTFEKKEKKKEISIT